MLEALRRGTQTWVAKLLFGLLVFSFAIWGVADVFTGYGRGAIASVGKTEIPVEDFQRSFRNELDRFSQQSNRKLTPEQGKQLGLDRRVLEQLVGGAAIEAHARENGLAFSDKTLVEGVQTDPDFAGQDGKFSKDGFEDLLRQAGLSEKGFLDLRRKDELRKAMIGSFVQSQVVPKPLLDALHQYRQEKRTLEWLKIDADKAVTVPEPDEAKLKEAYEKEKNRHMTPEYKAFELLTLTVDDLKKTVEVTDDEIAKSYEATKDTYDTPEQRRIQQIAFKDKAAADVALKALRDGSKTLGDVAKDAGAKDTDVDLGLVNRKALIDPKIADAAFALEKDKYSEVVEGRFATVILRVTQIEAGRTETLAGVKSEVKDKLAAEKARSLITAKFDEVEDNRSAGKSLKDIAETMKLTFTAVPAADKRGSNKDGKPAVEGPDAPRIIARVFAPETPGEVENLDLGNGGHGWINIGSTEEPKQKPYEEVKEDVKGQFLANEKARLISELSAKLVERINAGEPMSAIADVAKAKLEKTDAITRTTQPQGLSDSAVALAFTLAQGKAGRALTTNKDTELIFRVEQVTKPAAPTESEAKTLSSELEQDLSNQMLFEYTTGLKRSLGATVNETELKRALGTADQ